ncbi:MAG: UPF0182 family protein [Armatimonadetes bacterium]|nr:UPF0182 family protein [Armatimonadota bacterium]
MRIRLSLLILLFVFFILAPTLSRWYTDWLWFGEVGYRRVFWVPLLSRIGVTVVVGGTLFALFIVNLRPLLRRPPLDDIIDLEPRGRGGREFKRVIRRPWFGGIVIAVLALIAFLSGLAASAQWPMFQQFVHAQPFGVTDPIFGRDVGFFVFRLPVYQFVESWLFGWLMLIFLAAAAAYYLRYTPMMLRGVWSLPAQVRAHLSLLAGAIVLVRGWGFWLDAFSIEYSQRGAIVGAGYTDVRAVLPALRLLTVLFVVCAALLFINVRRRTLRPAVGVILVIALAWVIGLGVVPRFVQQFRVSPNELTVETPYIRYGIASTLKAFGLDRVREQVFSAEPVTAELVSRNRPTVDNVRLWDYRPLLSAYRQLQTLRPYYLFGDVDIDRYRIAGVQRQVMLSARELDPGRLAPQARTWVNEHLVFTHGYGLVMSPVNRASEEGMPEFFLKDIPPVGEAGLRVSQPAIYFGEHTGRYVIVNTRVQELDYPRGDENVYTSYAGRGGIPLTRLRRAAFAYRFGDMRLLLSSDVTSSSRLMFAREITTRVRRLAPFLSYDRDPYVVLAGGRLKWVIDAYTTSNRYPYATPAPEVGVNYIRNSVKVIIDAYDGTADFYVVDPADPLARSFASIFPELFKPASQMPAELVAHLRYPVDLFEIQARMYATFHMKDPRVFYNREDVWAVPTELFGNETVLVEPYYVTMRLANDPRPEFILILPFVPAGRDNLIAWMAARNDGPRYGELVVYRFPKDRLAFGPMQVESRINQDPVISQQLTLWNQEGSRVIRGNLLVIPMEDALMYVEPLFLQAERSQLPELKRVIVASGPRIVMDETLDGAIARLLGRAPPAQPSPGAPPAPGPSTRDELIAQALESYDRAEQLLRQGDFAGYAREIERLGQILRQLEQSK